MESPECSTPDPYTHLRLPIRIRRMFHVRAADLRRRIALPRSLPGDTVNLAAGSKPILFDTRAMWRQIILSTPRNFFGNQRI